MKGEIKTYFKENKKLLIGILISVLITGGIFLLYTQLGEKVSIKEIQEKTEPDWLERTEEAINKYHKISDEADALKDQGKYTEAIVKYKEALDLIGYRTLLGNSKDDFYETYKYLSKEKQLDKAQELTAFGIRTASTYYSLSFAYRDAKELANNIQYAIDSAKQAVEEINKVILLGEIMDELNPDRFELFGKDYHLKTKAEYLSILADLYRIHGAYDLSIKTHKQAIILDSENAKLYVWYGLALYLDGQYSLGRAQWRKALELDPDNADASKFLRQFSF